MKIKKHFEKEARKKAIFCLWFGFFILTIFGLKTASAVWHEPTATPPGDNIFGFLHIGPENQAKRGDLRLGAPGTPISPLDVQGDAEMNALIVDQGASFGNTLFVDNSTHNVGIGTNPPTTKLDVSGGVKVGNESNPISTGIAIEGYSSSSTENAIQGVGTTGGAYGLADKSDSSGVSGISSLGIGVFGQSTNVSGVAGEVMNGSAGSYGVYGCSGNYTNDTCDPRPLAWAGYFSGRVFSDNEVIGTKFLPTTLQNSLIPYTSGQIVNQLTGTDLNNINLKTFDGTYLWGITGDNKVLKIRTSDGRKILEKSIGTKPSDVIYDGNYIWITDETDNKIRKINPVSGELVTGCDDVSVGSKPVSAVFDGTYVWVANYGNDTVSKISASNCSKIGDYLSVGDGPSKLVYDGQYAWVLNNGSKSITVLNPANYQGVQYVNLIGNNPQDIVFDGTYLWVTNSNDNTVSKLLPAEDPFSQPTPQPVKLGDYSTGTNPQDIVFDGTYLWVTNAQGISRILAADPSQKNDFPLGFAPTGLVFDGTYLWVANSTDQKIYKIYSGTGWGKTDLSGLLTLQEGVSPLDLQTGHFNVSGAGVVGQNVSANGNVSASGNVWGGASDTEITVSIDGSENCEGKLNCFNCPNGYFINNIEATADGKPTKIHCRPL